LLGMFDKFIPKFVKKYSELAPVIKQSVLQYDSDVQAGSFPGVEHGFTGQGDYSQILNE